MASARLFGLFFTPQAKEGAAVLLGAATQIGAQVYLDKKQKSTSSSPTMVNDTQRPEPSPKFR